MIQKCLKLGPWIKPNITSLPSVPKTLVLSLLRLRSPQKPILNLQDSPTLWCLLSAFLVRFEHLSPQSTAGGFSRSACAHEHVDANTSCTVVPCLSAPAGKLAAWLCWSNSTPQSRQASQQYPTVSNLQIYLTTCLAQHFVEPVAWP